MPDAKDDARPHHLLPGEITRQLARRKVNTGIRQGGVLEKYALTLRSSHQEVVTHSGAVTWLRDES